MAPWRVLLVGSQAWTDMSTAEHHLRGMATGGFKGATLLHRDVPGVERLAGRWWRACGGGAEVVRDFADGAARADSAVVLVSRLCPVALAGMDVVDGRGLPSVLAHVGEYPFPAGSEEAQRQRRTGRRRAA